MITFENFEYSVHGATPFEVYDFLAGMYRERMYGITTARAGFVHHLLGEPYRLGEIGKSCSDDGIVYVFVEQIRTWIMKTISDCVLKDGDTGEYLPLTYETACEIVSARPGGFPDLEEETLRLMRRWDARLAITLFRLLLLYRYVRTEHHLLEIGRFRYTEYRKTAELRTRYEYGEYSKDGELVNVSLPGSDGWSMSARVAKMNELYALADASFPHGGKSLSVSRLYLHLASCLAFSNQFSMTTTTTKFIPLNPIPNLNDVSCPVTFFVNLGKVTQRTEIDYTGPEYQKDEDIDLPPLNFVLRGTTGTIPYCLLSEDDIAEIPKPGMELATYQSTNGETEAKTVSNFIFGDLTGSYAVVDMNPWLSIRDTE